MMTHDDNGDGDVVTRVASVYSSTQIARHRNRMQLLQQSDSECSDDESVKSASEHNNQDLDINIRIFENENSVQTNITGEILCKLKNNIENKTAAVKFDSDYGRFHSSTENGATTTTVGGSSRTNFKVIFNANFENCIDDNGIVNIDHLRTLIQADRLSNGTSTNFARSPVKETNCIAETLLRFTDKTNNATSVPTKTLNATINGQPSDEDIFDINDIGMALLSRKNLMKKRTTSAMVKLKREYQRKAKESNHETTMVDLIFYNPPSSMTSSTASDSSDSNGNKTASLEEEEKVVVAMTTTAKLETPEPKSEQRDGEEIVDDRATEMEEDLDDESSDDSEMKEESITGVPQLIVDADGNIVIDTKSLRVESTVSSKSKQLIARNGVVFEEGRTMQPRMKKRAYTKPWSATDTLKFYMLLNTFTTDFTQIAEFFKDRTRNCIKRKYKKEEKSRPQLVEKALRANSSFNVDQLKKELSIFDKIKRLKTGDSSSLSPDTSSVSAQRSRGRKRKNIVSDKLMKLV